MILIDRLTRNRNAVALSTERLAVPNRTRPRLDLASGRVVAHAMPTRRTTSQATMLARACALAGRMGTPVSIGLQRPVTALPALVEAAVNEAGLAYRALELAFTAQQLAQMGMEALLCLSALQDRGVGVALSGFAMEHVPSLARLPLSTVLLTRAALRAVPEDRGATAALRQLLALAEAQDLTVVATGVETEAQRAVLAGLGCAQGEGSLFGASVLQREKG